MENLGLKKRGEREKGEREGNQPQNKQTTAGLKETLGKGNISNRKLKKERERER